MVIKRIRNLQELVQDAIDRGARTVEDVHMAVAKQPFDVLARLSFLQEPTAKARGWHDRTIGGVYDAIRELNRRIGEIARELLDRVDPPPPPPPRATRTARPAVKKAVKKAAKKKA